MTNKKQQLWLSASQLDTFKLCPRKWWLQKVAKLPQPSNRKLLLGDVGHAVAERFQNGEDLYPEGWEYPVNRFTGKRSEEGISPSEQALVKALIRTSIDEGVLNKEPDGEAEKEFKFVADHVGDTEIKLLGFLDYFHGNTVEDHKFTGAPQYYGKSKLSKATAMNLYAWAMYEEGIIKEPTCWLRYNLFVKDMKNPMVKPVSVEKDKQEVYDYYAQEIRPQFAPMVKTKKNCKEWHEVDSAMDQGCADKACNAFGGCEFLDICMGKISPDTYKERFLDVKKKDNTSVLERLQSGGEVKKEEKKMSGFLSKIAAQQNGAAPAPEAPAPAPEAPKQAPWYQEDCPMCKKADVKGINKQGEVCNICNMLAKEKGTASADDYELNISDDGKIISWVDKETAEPVAESVPVEKEPEVAKEQIETKGGSDFEEEAPDPQPADLKETDCVEGGISQTEAKELYSPERTGTKGWVLSYAPVRQKTRVSKKLGEPNCVILLSEFAEVVESTLLAAANKSGAGAADWYSLDTWARRDLIRRNAKELAELMGNSWLDCSALCSGSDEEVLVASIERYASFVIGSK